MANTIKVTKKRTINELTPSFEYRSRENIEKENDQIKKITSNSMHIRNDNTVRVQGVTINLNDTDGSMDEDESK